MQLVLSLFPGLDLFGMAFEEAGFSVVRGPDRIMGGDIRNFHIPPNKFDGIIGGPPCQMFSIALGEGLATQGNLIPEFVRIIEEGKPKWWVMENVPQAPIPYELNPKFSVVLNAHDYGAKQHRKRRFCSNLKLEPIPIHISNKDDNPYPCVTAGEHKYHTTSEKARAGRKVGRKLTIEEINILMGLPSRFYTPLLKLSTSYAVRGNGVPIPMGLAIAKSVIRLINQGTEQCVNF